MPAKKKVNPLGNRLVVEREDAPSSRGGILLPDSAQKKPREGKVLAVGPGKADEKGRLQRMDVKVGDIVLFSSYGGTEYKLDEKEVLILSEEDVLAVYQA